MNMDSEGVFDSVDEAKSVLMAMLKYFSKDSVDNENLAEYLTSHLVINEVGENESLSAQAEHRSAMLVINVPISKSWTEEKIEARKLEVLVRFSSMLDESKTKTLIEIYKSLKAKAKQSLI